MGAVDFQHLKAGAVGARGGGREAFDYTGNFSERQRMRCHVSRRQRLCGRSDQRVARFALCSSIGRVEGATAALPGLLPTALVPGMRDLNSRQCPLRADKVGYPLEPRQEAVRPDAEITIADTAAFLDGRGFGKDQAHAAECELAQMHQMPIVGVAVDRTILAHGRQHYAVAKGDAGNPQRGEQKRHL